MQSSPTPKPPIGVIFDAALGERIDTTLALALLYGFDGKEEARVVSVSVSKPHLRAAAYADVIARFYAGAVSGDFAAMRRTLPIGLAETSPLSPADTPLLKAVLDKKGEDGKPAYAHSVDQMNDTADPAPLIRNAFTAQHDGNCVVVLAGPATNLAATLRLAGASEWAKRKVKMLVWAAGDLSGATVDDHITADLAAARKLLTDWPTPLILAGRELSSGIGFPGSSLETNFSYAPNHPIADAYRAAGKMPFDAPVWSLPAVMHAVRTEAFFSVSEPGNIVLDDSGRTKFQANPQGRHQHLIAKSSEKESLLTAYRELVSAKPVVRAPRRRRLEEAQKKAEEQKKLEEQKKAQEPKP